MKTDTQYLEPVGFKGTKEKWYYHNQNTSDYYDIEGEGRICSILIEPEYDKEAEANAKLISQSKELAKALQDMVKEGHGLFRMYVDIDSNDTESEREMYKLFRSMVGKHIEIAEQVLKDAGLTDK